MCNFKNTISIKKGTSLLVVCLFIVATSVQAQNYAERRAHELARIAGSYVIDEIFDGGINGKYELINYCFDDNCDWVKFRLTFNGNIVTTNYYSLDVKVGPDGGNGLPVIWFDNMNDKAYSWWIFKNIVTGIELYKEFQKYYESKK